jgi:hypothetical protein
MTAKKTTRRKAYKNMSVSELVKERAELAEKIQKIDEVLGAAVEAVGVKVVDPAIKQAVLPIKYNRSSTGGYDPAFGSPDNYKQPVGAQVAIGNEAPIVPPRPNNNPNQDSGFTIFDADSFARKQAEADQQYLVNNPGTPVPPEYDFASEEVSSEIDALKEQISKGLKNEGDTESDT